MNEASDATKNYGKTVDHPGFGMACADCGYDAHEGPCKEYYCKSCGVECGSSGCSLHPSAGVNVYKVPRRG